MGSGGFDGGGGYEHVAALGAGHGLEAGGDVDDVAVGGELDVAAAADMADAHAAVIDADMQAKGAEAGCLRLFLPGGHGLEEDFEK